MKKTIKCHINYNLLNYINLKNSRIYILLDKKRTKINIS